MIMVFWLKDLSWIRPRVGDLFSNILRFSCSNTVFSLIKYWIHLIYFSNQYLIRLGKLKVKPRPR